MAKKPRPIACLTVALLAWLPVWANLPYRPIQWPADDQAHLQDPKVVTEWWYFAGKLTVSRGLEVRHFSYYVTLRYMRDIEGDIPTLDVQLTDLDEKRVYGNSVQLNDARLSTFKTSIIAEDFQLEPSQDGYILRLTVPAGYSTISLDLTMTPLKKHLPIANDLSQPGLVDMGSNTNSFYYVIPRMKTEGFLEIGSKKYTINSDTQFSRSWMEHQWGDFSVPEVIKAHPWIWMSIQLQDGTDINIGQFIAPSTGEIEGEGYASISLPDGTVQYKKAQITLGNEYEDGYPLAYTVRIEDQTYQLRAVVANQDVNDVWMGMMSVNGQNVLLPNASFAIVENTVYLKDKLPKKGRGF